MTYTDRTVSLRTVTKKDEYDASTTITDDTGWSYFCPPEVAPLLEVGDEFWMETYGFNRVGGWLVKGQWLHHTSDEEFAEAHAKFMEESNRRRQDALDANRAIWQTEEERLPQWIRNRLTTFHKKGGENFDLEGWGYELCVAHLAVLYVDSNLEDSEAVNEFASREGTSGNQHDVAKALAKAHLADPSWNAAGTISALSPLTGSAYYEKRES